MFLHVPASLLLAVTFTWIVTSNGYVVKRSEAIKVDNCTRAMEPMILLGKYVERCEYLCEGLPTKVAPEDDGTPCKVVQESGTVVGVCAERECVENADGEVPPQHPKASV